MDEVWTAAEALAAAKEEGRILLRVLCGECGSGKKRAPLALVRSSTKGPVFDAALPDSVHLPDDLARGALAQARAAGMARAFVMRECSRYLLHGTADHRLAPPEVKCSTHGRFSVPPADLLAAVRSGASWIHVRPASTL